jgi:hypothetical protein
MLNKNYLKYFKQKLRQNLVLNFLVRLFRISFLLHWACCGTNNGVLIVINKLKFKIISIHVLFLFFFHLKKLLINKFRFQTFSLHLNLRAK